MIEQLNFIVFEEWVATMCSHCLQSIAAIQTVSTIAGIR